MQSGVGERVLQGLAALIALAFIVTLPLLVLLRAGVATALDRELVTRAMTAEFVESGVLRRMAVRQIVPRTAEDTEEDAIARMTIFLSEEDWGQISRIAVPDGWMEEQLELALASAYAWLEGDEVMPTVAVNTEPVKRRLIGDGTEDIVAIIVDSWPVCAELQVAEMERAFREGGVVALLECQPPEPFRSVLIGLVADAFRREARQLPSEITYGPSEFGPDAAGFLELKSWLRALQLIASWGFLLPMSLLGVIMALTVRSWRQWSRWWGVPLLLSGLATFALVGLFAANRQAILADWVAGMEIPVELLRSAGRVLVSLFAAAVRRAMGLSLVVTVVGAALVVISFLLPKRSRERSIKLDRRPS